MYPYIKLVSDASLYHVFQIKISVRNIKPSIWRRFQVPDHISLYKLHKIIQILMDWYDYHLFQFTVNNVCYGMPDPECDYELKDARRFKLDQLLHEKKRIKYEYDFGDSWEVDVLVEKIFLSDAELKHPICLAGKRAGPLEDSGGPWGYSDLIEILKTPPSANEDEETKEKREWAGEDYDPEYFDLGEFNQMLKVISTGSRKRKASAAKS